MKSFFLALVATVCLSVSSVQAKGICYDPVHGNTNVNADSIRIDLTRLRDAGFKAVRTYVVMHSNQNLGMMIVKNNMNASLTVPFVNDRPGDSEIHIKGAIEAAKHRNGAARVTHIWVGNENLASVNAVPQQMFDFITRLKNSVPKDVLVGTVQRNTEYLDPARNGIGRWKELLDRCTIAGINIHPIFTPNTPADKGVSVVNAQWGQLFSEDMKKRFPGLTGKLAITEVGWPSGGSMNGNTGTKAGSLTFMNAYADWRKRHVDEQRSFYFQAFDQPQRNDGPFEKFFGILESNGNNKFTTFNFKDM
ncbi:hypothetical protein Poli38472_013784 [Pythium oligandrum]|uniref:glucan endo-1,3-beta-D-glucosidase n=1 Tax=Pythium oligandrum TaxID=41045 RepID=A0A8K1FCZ8_PYTOL|nr:hypothetical protein Poli38472_013784 [Pythium oligandrum]|eukprot:TMW55022.1 hypothetical protein Poli38472_013784 [Pythium oligandrum]